VWRIPKQLFKTNKTVDIPLLPQAIAILTVRKNDTKFVFPNPARKCGHVIDVWFWLRDVREKMGELGVTKHFTIHDLRRTFATRMTAAGAPLTIVSSTLGHANVQTTAIYARSDTEIRRQWMPPLPT
jgi:integrase